MLMVSSSFVLCVIFVDLRSTGVQAVDFSRIQPKPGERDGVTSQNVTR
jgi:hypothetical protein